LHFITVRGNIRVARVRNAGAASEFFSGKKDNLHVKKAKEALCLEGMCGVVM
jgi:hypothetical protein